MSTRTNGLDRREDCRRVFNLRRNGDGTSVQMNIMQSEVFSNTRSSVNRHAGALAAKTTGRRKTTQYVRDLTSGCLLGDGMFVFFPNVGTASGGRCMGSAV